MHTTILPSIIQIFLLSVLFLNICESRLQLFTIHQEEDCSDVGENITKSVRDLSRFSYLVKCSTMKCFCNHYGIWIFSMLKNYRESPLPHSSGLTTMTHDNGRTCQSNSFNRTMLQLKSARHVGNSNSTLPALSLYIGKDFFGKELYFLGQKASLLSPVLFGSFGMTGSGVDWTTYPRPNFLGSSTCLRGNRSSKFTLEPNKYLTVASLHKHCYKKDVKLTFSESYLILFIVLTERGKLGKVVIDGNELRLLTPTTFTQFLTIGTDSWSVYSGTEFNGKFMCLTPDYSEKRRKFKKMNGSVRVGSVKKGCVVDECMDIEEDDFTLDLSYLQINEEATTERTREVVIVEVKSGVGCIGIHLKLITIALLVDLVLIH